MARVLVPTDGWYDELRAVAYYGEAELERYIRQHVRAFFTDYYVFPFKKDVVSRSTSATKKPDLAMIRRDFAAWGVIEVEVGEHDISHVLDQTAVFLEGDYNAPEMAGYIKTQLWRHCRHRASIQRLTKLLSLEMPSVLVIADEMRDGWEQQLNDAGVELCIFEIYKSTRGRNIYRACGKYPAATTQEAHCRRHKSVSNLFELIGNFSFKGAAQNKQVYVWYGETLTRWSLVLDQGRTYLQSLGKNNPLSPNQTYRIVADRRDRYYLEIN
ncbi:MAG: hypothetical protein QOI04_1172 [Verrucomicrobiota bacterium]|jgi:hypothetical protein